MGPPLPPDPYKILGVSKDAQTSEIRSAHRKLVLKCHPDKIQDPKLKAAKQDEFQKVQQAYELLTDDSERQKYDDKVKLAELRKQMQDKVHISSPRPSTRYAEFEIRTPQTRSASFKASPASPASGTKPYSYSRYDDDYVHGARIFETVRPSRRESSYADKPSKREVEREREREKDRDRERRKKDDEYNRRSEKSDKEARRTEKKKRDKTRDKEIKRESEEKSQRYARPYVEEYEEEVPLSSRTEYKRSSSSKKHDDKRDRSNPREEPLPRAPARPPLTRVYSSADHKIDRAQIYMEATRAKGSVAGLRRSASYTARQTHPPAAPTPPPAANKTSAFAKPSDEDDEEVRRSSARRRGSGEDPYLSRERPYRQSSRDVLDDPVAASPSPATRHPAQFQSSAPGSPMMSASPPRVSRTKTMPIQPEGSSRQHPSISRAQTFNSFGETSLPRGRDRSRLDPQVLDSDSDDVYERRLRDRKVRSSRRTQSPEPARPENVTRYQYEGGGRTRQLHSFDEGAYYYPNPAGVRMSESRIPASFREASYGPGPGMAPYPSVKTSKAYSYDDVKYSDYQPGGYRRYPVHA